MNVDEEIDDLAAELGEVLDADKPAVEQPQEGAESETPAEQDERLYRRDGRRFVAKEQEQAAKQEPKPGEQQQQPQEQQAQPDLSAKPPWRPPWYKDEYGPWDKLPENFRNALREQERNAAQAIEKHSTSAKAWEPMVRVLEPYAEQLRAANQSPQEYLSNLHQWNVALMGAQRVEDRIDLIDALARSFGVDLVQAGQWLAKNGSAPQPDPRDALINELRDRVKKIEAQPQLQQQDAARAEIHAWSKDKPDFAALKPVMAALAKQNPQASLDELYSQAQWAHPETRERILKEQEDKRVAELRGKQRLGAQSPRGGQPNGAAHAKPKMSLEEEIAMTLDGAI